MPRPDLFCVSTHLFTDTTLEDSVHPALDGANQEDTSVFWKLLGSEALGPSPGDFTGTSPSGPPILEETSTLHPGMEASGVSGEAHRELTTKTSPHHSLSYPPHFGHDIQRVTLHVHSWVKTGRTPGFL